MDEPVPTAIKVDHVYKDFILPHEKAGSVKNVFTNLFRYIKSKRNYDVQHALSDVSFEIKLGEFFGIVGRNGSGKSTLLKMIAAIYQPTKGSIQVNGKIVPFIELGVGFNGELTGRENVYLNGALLGFTKKEMDALYKQIVEFAELGAFMDQKLKNYSSGMQVRLAFSLAIQVDTDILLVDEVLAVGDADFQRKCFRYFKQLKKNKKTVIFVTHDMNAVREYCDRGALIEKSKVVAIDKPERIAQLYERLLAPKSTKVLEDQQHSSRWGDNTLKIEHIRLDEMNDKEVIFNLEILANRTCGDPAVGFALRNEAGVSLLGSNTIIEKHKIPSMDKGSKINVKWTFKNVLADGDYYITVAALYENGATTGDWWEDALSIRVTRPVHVPYLVHPDIKVDIN